MSRSYRSAVPRASSFSFARGAPPPLAAGAPPPASRDLRSRAAPCAARLGSERLGVQSLRRCWSFGIPRSAPFTIDQWPLQAALRDLERLQQGARLVSRLFVLRR